MAERSYIKGDRPVPDYRLVKFLGKGGFGEVWQATGPGGIEVALKIIPLDNKQGFKEFRAIRMVKNVRNAHLVPIVGFWLKDSNGNLFDDQAETDSFIIKGKATELIIAMGLGEKSLMDRLEECQKEGKAGVPVEELLDYMVAVAKAIDFLNRPIHNSGSGQIAIQHCDVKPQNVMLVGGEAQLCDFGLARVLGDPRTTQSGNMMMSVPYTSPEMFEASKPSHSSDQYALAITYYELRTGELPFENPGNPASMMYQIMQGRLDLSRLTDPAERAIVKRATSLDPDKRYPTSLEMVRDLRRVIEGAVTPPSSKPTGPKAPPGPEAEGTEIVPGYKLVRRLGQGGYGTVWEAQAPGGKRVAIKIIHDVQGSSGRQEFHALELIKSLDHEHLLDLHAYWLKDKDGEVIPDEVRNQPNAPQASTLVIATKLAAKNLLQRLNECQREGHPGIPVPELLTYMRQAAQAIDFLNEPRHRFGDQVMSIQHRDIKPENILLVGRTAKVGDFGLAKVLEGTNAQVHGSSTGYTPHYAAPELFRGNVTRWTDQYSLAVTYFKLRTGRLPFDAAISLGDLLMMHLEGSLDLSALSEPERGIIARATSPEASQRYPSCLDMVNALERALTGEIRMPKAPLGPTDPEIALPSPSPKPASASKRPRPPSTPDGLTIRPEDEEGAVVVTAPDREAPREEVVEWPAETQEPGHDTPLPASAPVVAPDWRGGGVGQKEAPAKVTASARPSSTPELGMPNWRAGRRRPRKAPVALLATAVLIVGAAGTALSFAYFGKDRTASTEPAVTEAEVTRHIGEKQFTTALAKIDAGPFDADKKRDLRGQVLSAWLREAHAQFARSDFEAALAQAHEIRQRFPECTEAADIEAQAQASLRPPQPPQPGKTQEQTAQELLAQALNTLKTDPAKAVPLFKDVAGMPVNDNLKARAKLGQARAYFRLGKPTEAGGCLPTARIGDREDAVAAALRLWLLAPEGVSEETNPAQLKTLLAGLAPLRQRQDLLTGEDEGTWVKELETRVTRDLPEVVAKTAAAAPARDEAQVLKAFAQLSVIKDFYQEYLAVFEKDRQLAQEKLWQAARDKPKLPNPFRQPWPKDDMALVLGWLRTAQDLADMEPRKPLDLAVRKDLALACWYSRQKQGVARLLEDLPNEPKPDEVRYLFVKAKSQLDDDKSFEVYYAIVQALKGGTRFESEFVDQVLQPAITAGVQVFGVSASPADKRRLADCYLVKAKFLKDSPGLAKGDWELEYMNCYEAAFEAVPDAETGLTLSRLHLDWARQKKDAGYLAKAQRDVGQANPDPKIADLVYRQRALIHEAAATLFQATKEFDQAVDDLGKAIAANGQRSQYLVDLGRCYVEQALASAEDQRPGLKALAQQTLEKALRQLDEALKHADAAAAKTLKGGQSEAHHWLGVGASIQPQPDYARGQKEFDQSLRLAQELGEQDKALHATAVLYLYNIVQAVTKPAALAKADSRAALDVPIRACKSLRDYGPKFGGEYAEVYAAFAANSLATVGKFAYDNNLRSLGEIYQLLTDGLGGPGADLSGLKPGCVGLLNWRNAICLIRYEKNVDEKGFPTKDQLVKDVKAALDLVQRTPANFPSRDLELFNAHFNFARACLMTQAKTPGLKQAGLALGVPGISEPDRAAVRAVQAELEKLK